MITINLNSVSDKLGFNKLMNFYNENDVTIEEMPEGEVLEMILPYDIWRQWDYGNYLYSDEDMYERVAEILVNGNHLTFICNMSKEDLVDGSYEDFLYNFDIIDLYTEDERDGDLLIKYLFMVEERPEVGPFADE